ncbi:MAG: hypothetical protein AAGF89_17560 [Bacteroidota bacterium]
MKLLSFPIGDDLLEVYNNMWTGVETVTYNGHEVSRAFNWFKGVHEFAVASQDGEATDFFKVIIQMTYMGTITVDVFRNDECLLAQSDEARQQMERSRRGLDINSTPRSRNPRRAPRALEREREWREEDLV